MKSRHTQLRAIAAAKAGFSTATAYRIEADPRLPSPPRSDVVIKYIRDNPKDRHLNAATIAALAFKDAWPCETNRR